ncbi:MAG: hypothetical protein LPJ89_00250 [Hymenobacteraceae bacterium]|nr:hypothetical protein [Hymenobacteraceae bacterium]MDX5395223.1 hypothetical protein [Hymenobacteraceae bacterium]MDX5442194.1 hypothetical protein [Hymenobacteraceae bacterium]MDX5511261.1 hypothetical protein [Hymenobacteraceae bacterium]
MDKEADNLGNKCKTVTATRVMLPGSKAKVEEGVKNQPKAKTIHMFKKEGIRFTQLPTKSGKAD